MLIASLAAGCGHNARPQAWSEFISGPGAAVTIRSRSEVVGQYKSLYAKADTVAASIELDDTGALVLREASGSQYPIRLRDDGNPAMAGHYNSWLTRQGNRTVLHVLWCYRLGLYERIR